MSPLVGEAAVIAGDVERAAAEDVAAAAADGDVAARIRSAGLLEQPRGGRVVTDVPWPAPITGRCY